MFIKFKKWLALIFSNKHIRLFSDLVILLASGYLMIKKSIGFSVSGWLLQNAFHQPLVNIYVYVSATILIVAIISKIIILYFENFPPHNHNFVEPDEISDCLHRMNSEICSHLEKCSNGEPANIKFLYEQHGYKMNLALIVESLAEHIRKSSNNVKIKKKDLFISLYLYDENDGVLEYILHYDPKRDLIETKKIDLRSNRFEKYESVKCMKSTNANAYVLNGKVNYAKGASKRHKSIRHYLGCKLTTENQIYGFLNIEFHHNQLVSDEGEMQDFMEEHIYPFKLLLEYQFLKKDFFNSLKEFDTNWRAA
jgi:hypothetical protein